MSDKLSFYEEVSNLEPFGLVQITFSHDSFTRHVYIMGQYFEVWALDRIEMKNDMPFDKKHTLKDVFDKYRLSEKKFILTELTSTWYGTIYNYQEI